MQIESLIHLVGDKSATLTLTLSLSPSLNNALKDGISNKLLMGDPPVVWMSTRRVIWSQQEMTRLSASVQFRNSYFHKYSPHMNTFMVPFLFRLRKIDLFVSGLILSFGNFFSLSLSLWQPWRLFFFLLLLVFWLVYSIWWNHITKRNRHSWCSLSPAGTGFTITQNDEQWKQQIVWPDCGRWTVQHVSFQSFLSFSNVVFLSFGLSTKWILSKDFLIVSVKVLL